MNKIDWSRPIRFKNGRPARMVRVLPDGCVEVERLDEEPGMTRFWEVPPDGQFDPGTLGKRAGYDLENYEP